jgi:hypothetical protein
MAITHPYTGKARLDWQRDGNGVVVASVLKTAKYRKGHAYDVATVFAHIRPAYNALGLLDEHGGWVVTRNSFDEIREFPDIDMAKLYVTSLFALEHGAE